MSTEGIERLVKQAKSDSDFFHNLIWNTEKVLGSLEYLSREEKASILAVKPDELVAGLASGKVGGLGRGPVAADCGATCGASCGASCGATCGGSCGGSCTVTCAASCPATGLKVGDMDQVINPAETAMTAQQLSEQIHQLVAGRSFSRFTR
jgi:hypothetical protein